MTWGRPKLTLSPPRSGPKENIGENTFRFQCRAFKLPPFVEQFYFARSMKRNFHADFAFLEYRLLVEIKGGIWRKGGGAHSHPLDLERDVEREQYMALLKWQPLPVTPEQVQSGHAIAWTMRVLHARGWSAP